VSSDGAAGLNRLDLSTVALYAIGALRLVSCFLTLPLTHNDLSRDGVRATAYLSSSLTCLPVKWAAQAVAPDTLCARFLGGSCC
jgi:type III secretory pathway component EscT